MQISTCPTASVRAPIETAWGLLTDPASIARWTGIALGTASPPGSLVAGQRIEFWARAGIFGKLAAAARFRVIFDVLVVDQAAHRIVLDVRTPLGIVNHEVITCAPVSPTETFVSFG
jgi:uncharacterized protein YndB with AHSA1/START domain